MVVKDHYYYYYNKPELECTKHSHLLNDCVQCVLCVLLFIHWWSTIILYSEDDDEGYIYIYIYIYQVSGQSISLSGPLEDVELRSDELILTFHVDNNDDSNDSSSKCTLCRDDHWFISCIQSHIVICSRGRTRTLNTHSIVVNYYYYCYCYSINTIRNKKK